MYSRLFSSTSCGIEHVFKPRNEGLFGAFLMCFFSFHWEKRDGLGKNEVGGFFLHICVKLVVGLPPMLS